MHHFLDSILKFNTENEKKQLDGGLPPFATNSAFKATRDGLLKDFIKNLDFLRDLNIRNVTYQTPKIYRGGPDHTKTWFVYFYFRESIDYPFRRIKITGDINRLEDLETRELAAVILQKSVKNALEAGWKPGQEIIKPIGAKPQYTNAVAALEDAVKFKVANLRKRSASSYHSVLRLFADWLKRERLHTLKIDEISEFTMQRYQASLSRTHSPKTINNKMAVLSSIFTRLKKLKLIQDNPCLALETLPEEETEFYQEFTAEEINQVATRLKAVCPELFVFMLLVYYTLLRPITIVNLKREHLNFTTSQILIPGKIHKNKKKWIKQMLQPLKEYLIQYGYDKLEPGTYLFSSRLKPGLTLIQPVRASELWKKHVIDGMKIDKKLYALKHTMGSNYLNDNLGLEDLKWLQMQMAHSSLAETDTYVRKNTVQFLDETKSTIRKI